MINIFKKQIHESLSLQREDILKQSPLIIEKILTGISCDKLPNGKGEFGSITNPIPVNSAFGEIKYLGKLRGKTGQAIFFHRIGSFQSPTCENMVDCYEIVCIDGSQWNKLYFDMYHPRRSNIAPPGYSLMPLNKQLKFDVPMGFGINEYLQNFPFDIPEKIIDFYGSKALARRASERLAKHSFKKVDTEKENKIKTKPEYSSEEMNTNPAFNYIQNNYNIDCTIYKKLSQIIHNQASLAADQFAKSLKGNSNDDLVHFFFDYFLFFFSVARRQSLPKNDDAYSALIDGIHIEYYGNVNHKIVENTIELMTINEFCFLKTNYKLYEKRDLKMSITIAVYCTKKPELPGATEVLALTDLFKSIHSEKIKNIDNSFEILK